MLDRNSLLITILLALIYTGFAIFFGIIEHIGLRTNLLDHGVAEQAMWQFTNGNWSMPITIHNVEQSILTVHSFLIYYPVALIYALIPSSYTLIIISALSIPVASVLLFFLARSVTKNSIVALSFAVMLLANNLVQQITISDFRAIVLAIPLLIGVFLCLQHKKWILYWILLIALIATKEDMALLVLFMSLFVYFNGSKKHGVITAIVSASYFVLIQKITEKLFGSSSGQIAMERFDYLGSSLLEVVTAPFLNPEIIFTNLIDPNKIEYLIYIFFHGIYLAILSPLAFLIAIPNLAQNLLDQIGLQAHISGLYYSAIVITAIYIAAIYGYRNLKKKNNYLANFCLASVLTFAIVSSAVLSPFPYSKVSSWEDYKIVHDRDAFKRISSMIPPEASLATQNNLGAHFIKRQTIMQPLDVDNLDFILIHIQVPFARENFFLRRTQRINVFNLDREKYKDLVLKIFADSRFGVVAHESGFFLFKNGHSRELNREAMREAEEYLEEY